MSRFNSSIVVAVVYLAVVPVKVSQSAEPPAALDIRDPDGTVIIAADQIQSYDWTTHTLTLAPGTRAKVAEPLFKSTRLSEEKNLIIGIPFAVAVAGKPIYTGNFTSSVSSRSLDTPVIIIDPVVNLPKLGADELRIDLGYPTQNFFKGEDPRADPRIDTALRAARKLTSPRDAHIEWVAASLKEIQTIKPGMTREDLLKAFTKEGGVFNRFQRRYAYRDCPYIKVDVKFDFHEPEANSVKEHPQDKITQISPPFLEWPIVD